MIKDNFKDIVNAEFTAKLEDKLDDIGNGELDWKKLVGEYYVPFEKTLETAEKTVKHVELPIEESDEICEKCGARMIYKDCLLYTSRCV